MHLSLWKLLSHCLALILNKKIPRENGSGQNEINRNPSIIRKLQEHKLKEALEEASEHGSLVKYQEIDPNITSTNQINTMAKLKAQSQFLKATSLAADRTFESEDSIPDVHQSFTKFLVMYPEYESTEMVDHLRSDEYSHLSDHLPKVCLDYCGFGLFSFMQTVHYWESCTFNLSEITANLTNHAVSGGAINGTMEHDIKIRILDYMNIPDNEYELVFTVSRGSAFKLLAESYPFHNKKLLTMFDHESQSVNWMAQYAKQKGAKVQSAWFKWPMLQVSATDLRQQITRKKRKKKNNGTGLFVFPVQSRVTGTKYSYQWMSLAQQHNWHVLLDAGALGPKDMDSLGLSLYRPEFIITSFYKVFGYDPTGFGCLLIKKSMIGSLQNQPGHTGSGIVKINPVFPLYLSDSIEGSPGLTGMGNFVSGVSENADNHGTNPRLPVFSGAYTSDQVKEVFDTEMEEDIYSDFEENRSFSVGDVLNTPVFSEGESPEDSLWINLGWSPSRCDSGGGSTSPEPPFWFASKNKTKHLSSSKATSKITESLVIPKKLDRSNDHHITNSESAIRRETEGEFRLLGRREVNFLATNEEEDYASDNVQESSRQEPEISCRHLDHVNKLGLNKTTLRLRFLVNWLVTSLLQLRIHSNDETNTPLVHIYGPKIRFERGGSVAFNIRDKKKRFVDPEIVLKLAETNGISLGVAILSHIRMERKQDDKKSGFIRVEVVTCSLGFLTNFSDVYKLWAFVAKFMNPSFIGGGLPTVVEDE